MSLARVYVIYKDELLHELTVCTFQFPQIPSEIPSNFLDTIGVKWRCMDLVYTKKPYFIGLLGLLYISPEFAGVMFGSYGWT